MNSVGIIGAGKIGGSLLVRMAQSGGYELAVSDVHRERMEELAVSVSESSVNGDSVNGGAEGGAKGGVLFTSHSNREVAERSDLLIVAVKPWDVPVILREVYSVVGDRSTVVTSVAAGVTLEDMARRLPEGTPTVRVMPNVCAAIGLGSAVVTGNSEARSYLPEVMDIFRVVGDVIELPERLFDAATALHGSGPAYVALFADALVQAGVREGIPRETAKRLVSQTLQGTAVLLKDRNPHQVRDEVMTPGGTTAAAFAAMERSGFVAAIYDGIEAATEQARRLSK